MHIVWRLIRTYLSPYKKMILIRVLIAAVISASPYAFSFLGKWLVDSALQVTGPPKAIQETEMVDMRDSPVDAERTGETPGSTVPAKLGELGIEWKAKSPEDKTRLLIIFLAVSLGIHISITALSGWSEYLNSKTIQEVTYNLRSAVHEKIATADRSIISREKIGQHMTRVMDDAAGIPGNLTNLVINICTQFMMLILGICLLMKLNPSMTWIAVFTLPFYAVACMVWLPRLRKNSIDVREATAHLNGHLIERLSNVITIKNYAQEAAEIDHFDGVVDEQIQMTEKQHRLNLGFNTATTLITGLATLAVLALGFLRIRSGEMQLGEVLAFYQVTAQLFVPISALVSMTTVSQTLQVLGERVFRVLDTGNQLSESDDPAVLDDIRGEIRYENVSFQYQEGGPFALKALNLTIPAGKTVCIVGPTGCGKSSLISMLMRMYDPQQGRVLLDGTDLRALRLRQLRRSVGAVYADSLAFTGTFADNIAYGVPKAERDRIVEAAGIADLHEFIMAQPKQYDTRLGRGGLNLENEELTKLSLARALATNPAIIAIDNTFANLPEESEEKIRAALRTYMPGKTTIIATSRLSIAEDADLIVVMQRGQVILQGTHAELTQTANLYRRMYRRQMGI